MHAALVSCLTSLLHPGLGPPPPAMCQDPTVCEVLQVSLAHVSHSHSLQDTGRRHGDSRTQRGGVRGWVGWEGR